MARLCMMPSVGPVTAAAFVATVDDAKRFKNAHQVEAYLGLVPSEMSSGEKQRRGHITKTGNARMRGLLVQVAVGMMRVKKGSTRQLWEWAERLAARRGKNVAAVALARKLIHQIVFRTPSNTGENNTATGVSALRLLWRGQLRDGAQPVILKRTLAW